MAKKKKKSSKESIAPAKRTETPSTAPAAETPAAEGGSASDAAPAGPAAAAVDTKNKFDAAAHDRFASTFKPAWEVAQGDSGAGSEPARQEHALSGEISLDAIPLPPLPTEKPKRQMIGVAVVMLIIVGLGVAVSMRSSEPADAAPAAPEASAE
ncbi:MAG: hypothetical protein KC593_08180 [Myxococcales bacterium]|nr:hypothetical protein [Myxococcales bacterium]MCB9626135.1 hypothetical protein [Sandaracinaceae bacterium]